MSPCQKTKVIRKNKLSKIYPRKNYMERTRVLSPKNVYSLVHLIGVFDLRIKCQAQNEMYDEHDHNSDL